jgi:phosphatidylserine/phosphatidylglycerophosphate/cardiolipin synthase-like enzyme
MRLPCNKSNPWLPWLALCGMVLCLLVVSDKLLLRQTNILVDTHWNHDARILALQTDASRGEVHYLLIPFTAFGRSMVDEFVRVSRMGNPDLVIESGTYVTRIATRDDLLAHGHYLDDLVVANIWFSHIREGARSMILHAKQDAVPPDATHGIPASPPDMEPLFTAGQPSRPDNTLADKLRSLLQQAPAGSQVRFSVFLFYYENENEPLLQDILAAARRGVNVQLLVDLPETEFSDRRTVGMAFKEAFENRLKAAAEQGHSNSWIRTHKKIAPHSKNHTKIFLFSDAAGVRHWTLITSENLMDRDREKYQAGFITHDEKLYAIMSRYFDHMQNGNDFDPPEQIISPHLACDLFPQREDDPVYRQLDNMDTDPGKMQQSHLSIAMARWDHERFALAMKLVQLAQKGLQVDLVMRSNDEIVDPRIREVLENRPNIHLHSIDVNQINIHSKYMLFEGFYNTSPNHTNPVLQKIVWTGSHNFTGAGLEDNYETWVEIHHNKLYDSFLDNFHQLEALVPQESR